MRPILPLRAAASEYLDAVLARPVGASYSQLPALALAIETHHQDDLAALRANVLRIAIQECPVQREPCALDEEARERVNASRTRILAQCESDDAHFVRYPDRYFKDLALATGSMFPAGARIVQPAAGIPRRLAVSGGIGQALRVVGLGLTIGGKQPVFQLHVHPDELDEFSEPGWRRTLGRIARVMAINPETRALFGSSWLYAPELPVASPRLAYIRRIAIESGCRLYRIGPDPGSDALEKSSTRRKLAAEGRYTPIVHAAIWPRRDLIRLASRW